MALSSRDTEEIYEGLKYNFLFNNDANCIHILLNLYDLENNINNIFPRYVSMNHLRKSISRLLREKEGNHLIAYNLGELIHEDVNRLELYLYIEGYKRGFLDNKETNALENIAINNYSVPELYNLKYLYHYKSHYTEIADFKKEVLEKLTENDRKNEELYDTVSKYCEEIIKPKVMKLNEHLDKQLKMSIDLESRNIIEEDNSILTLKELSSIYEEVIKILFTKGEELYKEAYWYGLNDGLLRRYK